MFGIHSSAQNVSSAAPSPERDPVATAFSSDAPTTPQTLSTRAVTTTRDEPSPMTVPHVSSAASLRMVLQLSSSDPANVSQTMQPNDVDKGSVNSNRSSLGESTPVDPPTSLQTAARTPSTPSSGGSPTVATTFDASSDVGAQQRAVLFGSAPAHVLTTAPLKAKASRSPRMTKPRNQRRTGVHAV